MKLIFSADLDWGIGFENRLLFHIRGDMEYFRKMTLGKTVIMGRGTFAALPDGKPLADRDNIVLTSDTDFTAPGARAVHSLTELFKSAAARDEESLFVIGGEQVYRQLLPCCDTACVTRFYARAKADRHMPDFDSLTDWALARRSGEIREDGVPYRFLVYTRKNAAEGKEYAAGV